MRTAVGLYIFDSDPTIDNCIIKNNSAPSLAGNRGGGGIYYNTSSPTIKNCVIDNNKTTSVYSGDDGGGIKVYTQIGIECSGLLFFS